MQIGIDSFAAAISNPATGLTLGPVERMHHLLEEIELADRVGLDVFGIGEHYRAEFLDSAPVVILSAAATRAQFDALRGPTGALLIGDAKTVAKKVLYVSASSWRHLPRHISNGCLDASAPENVERHRDPRHGRGAYCPER